VSIDGNRSGDAASLSLFRYNRKRPWKIEVRVKKELIKQAFDLKRLWKATIYSCKGLLASFRHEAAFRLEIILSLIILPVAWWLGQSGLERGLLIASWLLVPLVELINSGIESVVDRIGAEQHELSGRAKDQGSAAVLIALVIATVIWIAVIVDGYY